METDTPLCPAARDIPLASLSGTRERGKERETDTLLCPAARDILLTSDGGKIDTVTYQYYLGQYYIDNLIDLLGSVSLR